MNFELLERIFRVRIFQFLEFPVHRKETFSLFKKKRKKRKRFLYAKQKKKPLFKRKEKETFSLLKEKRKTSQFKRK